MTFSVSLIDYLQSTHHNTTREQRMRILAAMLGLIGAIVCSNAFGGELKLICTGEERYPALGLKGPYSFQALVDLDLKRFTIQIEQNVDNKKDRYPRDNPWNRAECPIPIWKFEITDTELRIITACDEPTYKSLGSYMWEIRRTDGSFTLYNFKEERAKGKCVTSSERVF